MTHTATAPTRYLPDGTTITPAGRYEVHVRDLSAGLPLFRVEVLHAGSNQLHGDDHRSFPTRETAEHYAANLVECLTVEHTGISDERIAEVAAGVNANMDRTEGEYAAKVVAERSIAAEIMAESRGFRGDRKPITLADAVPAPTEPRPVRPTMAGAHLKPLNGVQLRALNTNRGGVVVPGDGITPATLKAIARKGYGNPRYQGNRKKIVALDLNNRGLAAATHNGATAC